MSSRWFASQYGWSYNAANQPSTAALARIRAAATTVQNGASTTCGSRSNGLTVRYWGTTTAASGVSATGCGSSDNTNVVGWGSLTGSTLARACWWNTLLGYQNEADLKFDTSSRSWHVSSSTTGCAGTRHDLQGVAVHELGHAVGLNHVAADEPQVMNPSLGSCSMTWRQLGRGDQNGRRAHYGT